MKSLRLSVANYALFLLVTFFLCVIQSSLFLQIFGAAPSPLLWIPPMIFWQIYKSPTKSLIMTYLISIVVVTLSQPLPIGILLFTHTIIYGLSLYSSKHIHGSGLLFFVSISGLAAWILPFLYSLAFFWFENKIVFSSDFLYGIIETLLTMLVSFLLFPLFQAIDQLTQQKPQRIVEA